MQLTAEDLRRLSDGLRRVAPIEHDELVVLLEYARMSALVPGEFLLRAGEPATHSGIVLEGLLREYFPLPDGGERTKAFVCAGGPTGSLADLLSQQPSRAFIVAEEATRLLQFDFRVLRERSGHSLSWLTWYAHQLEAMFIAKAEREYELLALDAEARYTAFRARFPGLEARVAARHVASYLGVTPVHLSRLRRRRRAAKKTTASCS